MALLARNARQTYRKDDVLTLSPVGLVVRVLAGAISSMERADQFGEQNKWNEYRKEVNRARALIAELRGALDHEVGGEISQNLDRLYDFVGHAMQPSSTPQSLAGPRGVLETIKEGFDVIAMNQGIPLESSS